jgi:hypothetical protein
MFAAEFCSIYRNGFDTQESIEADFQREIRRTPRLFLSMYFAQA